MSDAFREWADKHDPLGRDMVTRSAWEAAQEAVLTELERAIEKRIKNRDRRRYNCECAGISGRDEAIQRDEGKYYLSLIRSKKGGV